MKNFLRDVTSLIMKDRRISGGIYFAIAAALALILGTLAANAQIAAAASSAPESSFGQGITDTILNKRSFWDIKAPTATGQEQGVWQPVSRTELAAKSRNIPDDFGAFRLNRNALASMLTGAPHESRTPLAESELILQLPMPDGTFARFRVQEAPVLEESMQADFPEIKSYRIFGIDQVATTGRFDLTPLGFHATIISPGEAFVIIPADAADDSLYAVYNDRMTTHDHEDGAKCLLTDEHRAPSDKSEALAPQVVRGAKLKTYTMAFSTTAEYSQEVDPATTGGSRDKTVASINGWLNGLNAIFEREASIRLIMVKDYDAIYTGNANADPYDDRNTTEEFHASIMLNAVRNQLRDNVGEAYYNIGHLLTTNTLGGVAGLSAVCSPSTVGDAQFAGQSPLPTVGARKGAGYSVMDAPVGNLASLKLFAHEVGHQFGADHTQNGQCGRSNTAAYETGSGNTIMSYNGVCGTDNIVGGSDLRFHGYSYDQITNHIITGGGSTCGLETDTGNAPPEVSAGANYTIPKLTPFTLTATGSDLNDQGNVTYAWEQFQAGGASYFQNGTSASFTDAGDPAATTRPIFRATRPTFGTARTFPNLEYIRNNANDPPDKDIVGLWTAEELPRIGRTLNFRVTARDNVGGVNNSALTVTVDGNVGPFTVGDTSGPWTGGTTQTVTWSSNTASLAANVRISLSIDGGQSFPITLVPGTPNDGSEIVSVPNYISTSTARIKVEAVENIFFDISGTNFSIAPAGTCPIVTDISPKVAAVGGQVVISGANLANATAVTFSNNVNAPTFAYNSTTQKITATVPTGAVGGPITVTKAGCTASESVNFTVCPGTAAEFNNVDDGSPFASRSSSPGINYRVNRITPTSYPATLSEVRIYHQTFEGFPVGKAINIISAANPGAGTNIDNLTFKSRAATIDVRDTFQSYQVEPITIDSGDFVIGYSFVHDPSYPRPVAADPQPITNRSYGSSNGTTFAPLTNNQVFLIRAFGYSGACTSARCASSISVDDSTSEQTGTGGAGVRVYYVNRLTPSSYPATLTGVRLSTPFSSVTAIDVLSAASQSGSSTINSPPFKVIPANAPAGSGFTNYSVDPITIYSGDFIVGYSVMQQAGVPTIRLDRDPPLQGRSYYGNGTNFTLDSAVNYLIRAVLFSNTCSAGNCSYSLTSSLSNPLPAEGGEGIISITTQAGCPWRITRRNEWLSVNVASGSGNGTVAFAAMQNNFAMNRTGSLVVGPPTGYLGGNNPIGTNLSRSNLFDDNLLEGVELVFEQEQFAPTAATVNVGGRVTDSSGRAIKDAIVTIAGQNGEQRTARTSHLGYYFFTEVPVGESYVFVINSKGRQFSQAALIRTILDDTDDVNFIADN